MGTESSEIFDLFMLLQTDYRLNSIYTNSGSSLFGDYLQPWLLFAINDFDGICRESLNYDVTTQIFTNTLSQQTKLILAQLLVRYWIQKEVQDIVQMRLHIQDKDFKTFAEANNLKEKQNLYNQKREELSQILTNYELKNTDWIDWKLQNFDAT
jgi:hypothetical protein